jgi:hypothetical protein
MKQVVLGCIVVMLGAISAGCVTPAPGADEVKITRNRADVSGCTAVGNISAEEMRNLDPHVAQNQAVGLNADVVFNTGAGGVAYHCGKTAAPGQ